MTRQCCCRTQPHISDDAVNAFVKTEEYHLRNLSQTFGGELEGAAPYEIRERLIDSNVPFRYKGCSRGILACCGACTRKCNNRCPQDVMMRVYLLCGNILGASDDETKQKRYAEAGTAVQMIYDELTAESPRYFALLSMVNDYTSKGETYETNKYDYAAIVEFEEILIEHPNGYVETKTRKKVNPETGEASVLYWPRSGMCPFCLPPGLVDRRRTVGNKNRRRKRDTTLY